MQQFVASFCLFNPDIKKTPSPSCYAIHLSQCERLLLGCLLTHCTQCGSLDIDTDLDVDEHNGPYVIDIPNLQWWKFSLKYKGNQGNFVAKGGRLGIKGRNFASNIQSLERKIEKLHRRTCFGHCTIPFAHKVHCTSGGKCVLCVQIDGTQRLELPTTAVGQRFVQRGMQGAWGKLGGKVHPWWRKHKT